MGQMGSTPGTRLTHRIWYPSPLAGGGDLFSGRVINCTSASTWPQLRLHNYELRKNNFHSIAPEVSLAQLY